MLVSLGVAAHKVKTMCDCASTNLTVTRQASGCTLGAYDADSPSRRVRASAKPRQVRCGEPGGLVGGVRPGAYKHVASFEMKTRGPRCAICSSSASVPLPARSCDVVHLRLAYFHLAVSLSVFVL